MKKIKFNFLKLYWLWILIALFAAAFIFSSLEIYKEEVLNITPDITYEESKVLNFPIESIDTLNPIISQSEDTYYISKLIYNSLFDYDENMGVVPELVEEYTVDTERALIHIKLKEGITWHNGKKLKSEDVRFTINAIKAVGKKSVYYDKASKIMYANVKSDYEMDIFFRNNYNCSLADLTFPIVPASQYSSVSQFVGSSENFKPVGTGQYQYRSYNYLKRVRLKPYDEYFDEVAQNNLNFVILPDRKLASNMLEINSVTCYMDESVERKSTVNDKNLSMYNVISNNVEFVFFNQINAHLSHKEVRQAIAYLIDRDKILENAYVGDGVLTDTPYYPQYLGVAESENAYKFNEAKAKELLLSQGIKDDNIDGTLKDLRGDKISLRILVNKNNSMRVAAARIVEKNLENAGFDIEFVSLKYDEYLTAIKNKKFDILFTGYSMNEDYDLREFFNRKSQWGYYNSSMLTKVRDMNRLHTEEEYKEIYTDIKETLMEELPYYAICYKNIGLIGVSTFSAEKLPTFNDIYKNCNLWKWSYVIEKKESKESSEINENNE